MVQSVLEMAKELVLAQIAAGRLPPEDMQRELQKTHASLLALKRQEEAAVARPAGERAAVQQPIDWKQSVTRFTITCLECGAPLKQLTGGHLHEHGLDARSYRAKYGIPRTQPLAAREVTTRRRQIVQQTRPWEKAPRYMQAHGGKPPRCGKRR